MKKIIIAIISAMIMIPTMADAQIAKEKKIKGSKELCSVRMGFVSLMQNEECYWLSMKTTNQFDNNMFIRLGSDRFSAIQSLNDLIDILEDLKGNDAQYIGNGFGEKYRAYKVMGGLYFSSKDYAGSGNIGKSELKKFIKAIEKN